MTGIDPERRQRRLRWAAEQLGLSLDASPDEVRAAWLRRLPDDDFVPPTELRWALATLLRRQSEGTWETRADEAASLVEEERLRQEVEAFADQFWDLPSVNRGPRWQELMERCHLIPALLARLRPLERGLDLDAPELDEDALVVILAAQVRTLFVLRPGTRARTRQALLHRMREEREEWKTAAHRLRHVCPNLAALGSDLLDKVIAPALSR